MIALLIASAINLTAVQASISAPTGAFRDCLREAATKAKNEKVATDGIEAYLGNACTGKMGTLKAALVAFRLKNGMSQKAAASDAQMTIDDYVATSVDNYRFMADLDKPKSPAPAASNATPAPTPAAAPANQPPKP